MERTSTSAIYDTHAGRWTRGEPVLLSDFTARPFVIDELGPLAGTHVLDLGCGEGYVARLVADAGASSVFGVDASSEMVRNARSSVPNDSPCSMAFEIGDAAKLEHFPREQFDRVMAVFLFNYLTCAEMTAVLKLVRSRLAAAGRFVFAVPHPCFPYMRPAERPLYFDPAGNGYFAGVDVTYEGQIWRRDGHAVPVRCVHKTFTDYFGALAAAGFRSLPKFTELRVTDEHVVLDAPFFQPLYGYPLHVLFRVDAL